MLTPVLTGIVMLVVPNVAEPAATELTVFTSVGSLDWSSPACCSC